MLGLGELADEVYKHGRQADYVSMISDLIRKPKTLAKRFGREEERLALDVGFYSVLSREKPGPHERAVWRDCEARKACRSSRPCTTSSSMQAPMILALGSRCAFEASRV